MLGLIARIQLWRQLGLNLKAGEKIEDGLNQVAGGTGSGARLARLLLKTGKYSLSEAVATLSGTFSDIELAVIEAGEKTGRLPEACNRISGYLQSRKEMFVSLVLKLAYPVLIIHLAAFGGSFAQGAIARSGSSNLVFETFIALVPFYAIIFLFIILPFFLRKKNRSAGFLIDLFLLRFPFLGKYFVHEAEVQFFWLLGTLLEAGINIREAVGFAAGRVTNHVLRNDLKKVQDKINHGAPLAESLETIALSGNSLSRLESAETTGNLSAVSLQLFQESTESQATAGHGISGILWLFFMLVAGLYVGWAVIGFFVKYSNLFLK